MAASRPCPSTWEPARWVPCVGASAQAWQCTHDLRLHVPRLQKYCTAVALSSIKALGTSGKWSRFAVSLGDFGGRCGCLQYAYMTPQLSTNAAEWTPRCPVACSHEGFQGCGGAGWYDLTTLEFKNNGGSANNVCLDGIRMLPRS